MCSRGFGRDIHNTLSEDTGLRWESYTVLLTTSCCWMLIHAGVLAVQLEPGRGYSFTSFGEAMLGGIAPFIAASFDTLKDTLFGGLCFLSDQSGLHVRGGIRWAYLALLHVGLMFVPRFLAELFSNHLSVFALATRDLESEPTPLSFTEKVMAQIKKTLAPTKRQLFLVENIPQAGFAIIYLAVEPGSVVIALLNLAIPVLQVLVSLRVQTWLTHLNAMRLDSAMDDGDCVLGRQLCSELGKGNQEPQATVPLFSRHLRPIATARALERADLGHILSDREYEQDEEDLDVCRECLEAGRRADGRLGLEGARLSRPILPKELTAFVRSPWEILDLDSNGLSSDDADAAVAMAPGLRAGVLRTPSLRTNFLQDPLLQQLHQLGKACAHMSHGIYYCQPPYSRSQDGFSGLCSLLGSIAQKTILGSTEGARPANHFVNLTASWRFRATASPSKFVKQGIPKPRANARFSE